MASAEEVATMAYKYGTGKLLGDDPENQTLSIIAHAEGYGDNDKRYLVLFKVKNKTEFKVCVCVCACVVWIEPMSCLVDCGVRLF